MGIWLKFLVAKGFHKKGDIVWCENDKAAEKMIDNRKVVECINPETGLALADASPEKQEWYFEYVRPGARQTLKGKSKKTLSSKKK